MHHACLDQQSQNLTVNSVCIDYWTEIMLRETSLFQTFLCMSLKTTTTADAVGVHIQYYRPFIYTHNVPKWAMTNKMFPNILKLASGKKLKDDKGFRVTKLKTIGGVEFIGS